MNVLSLVPFVRNGHFNWCPVDRGLVRRDCQRCQGEMYLLAMVVAVMVAWYEFWGSEHTGSLSLQSDAWHVVSDGLGYLIGLVYALLSLYRVSRLTIREQLKYVLEFLMAAFLIVTAVNIGFGSVAQLWLGQAPVIEHSGVLFQVALIGLMANVALLLLFHAFGVGHAHDHSSEHDHAHSHDGNPILRGNFWHTLADTVSSVLVIGNGVIFSVTSNPTWRYLDLVVSIGIAGLLFWQGFGMLTRSWKTN